MSQPPAAAALEIEGADGDSPKNCRKRNVGKLSRTIFFLKQNVVFFLKYSPYSNIRTKTYFFFSVQSRS